MLVSKRKLCLFGCCPVFDLTSMGKTKQVEQLHKIFKLCGSPPEEFWKKTKLPHAAMFRPQHAYESSLNEKCKEFAPSAVSLLETFLAIEPYKRGTASSALMSEVTLAPSYSTSQISIGVLVSCHCSKQS